MLRYTFFVILNVMAVSLLAGTASDANNRHYLIKTIKNSIREEKWLDVVTQTTTCINEANEATGLHDVYLYRMQANEKLLKQQERKMYLHQSNDTVTYLTYIYNIIYDGGKIDSICTELAGGKSRAVVQTQKKAVTICDKYAESLKIGGLYYYDNLKYAEALKYIGLYISTFRPQQSELIQMSRLAFLSAYSIGENQKAAHFTQNALKKHRTDATATVHNVMDYNWRGSDVDEESMLRNLYELSARNYESIEDIKNFKNTLTEGMRQFPEHKYFYLSLIGLYNQQGNYQKSLDVAGTVIDVCSTNRDLWFIKGNVEVRIGKVAEALTSFKAATEIQADDADSYAAMGNIYISMARDYKNVDDAKSAIQLAGMDTSNKQTRRRLYLQAKESFERARQFAENRTDLWLAGLKEVYYRLNMGEELKELDNVGMTHN